MHFPIFHWEAAGERTTLWTPAHSLSPSAVPELGTGGTSGAHRLWEIGGLSIECAGLHLWEIPTHTTLSLSHTHTPPNAD